MSGLLLMLYQVLFPLQESLNSEMDQDLNTTLSTDDQQELADLAEEIKNLTKESKQALRERSQVNDTWLGSCVNIEQLFGINASLSLILSILHC